MLSANRITKPALIAALCLQCDSLLSVKCLVKACFDLTGKECGKWAVLQQGEPGAKRQARFKCICECGNERLVYAQSLREGRSKSCGRCPNPNEAEHFPDGSTALTLERRNGDTYKCFIDTADYPAVQKYRWWVVLPRGDGCYAQTRVPETRKQIFIHQLLSGIKDIDHADRNGLNNRRSNLRTATRQQQQANHKKHRDGTTSRYRGVSLHKETNKFRSAIVFNGKQKHLGLFALEDDAARAFNKAAEFYFGEFASLNDVSPASRETDLDFAPAGAAA